MLIEDQDLPKVRLIQDVLIFLNKEVKKSGLPSINQRKGICGNVIDIIKKSQFRPYYYISFWHDMTLIFFTDWPLRPDHAEPRFPIGGRQEFSEGIDKDFLWKGASYRKRCALISYLIDRFGEFLDE